MSKADKMFKKLGFYKQSKPIDKSVLLFYVIGKTGEYVIFYKDKTISTFCSDRLYIVNIDMELLQAINEKVKELGWNE